jgi:hypothetical protein
MTHATPLPKTRCLCGAKLYPRGLESERSVRGPAVTLCDLICANGCRLSHTFGHEPPANLAADEVLQACLADSNATRERKEAASALERAANELLSQARKLRETR